MTLRLVSWGRMQFYAWVVLIEAPHFACSPEMRCLHNLLASIANGKERPWPHLYRSRCELDVRDFLWCYSDKGVTHNNTSKRKQKSSRPHVSGKLSFLATTYGCSHLENKAKNVAFMLWPHSYYSNQKLFNFVSLNFQGRQVLQCYKLWQNIADFSSTWFCSVEGNRKLTAAKMNVAKLFLRVTPWPGRNVVLILKLLNFHFRTKAAKTCFEKIDPVFFSRRMICIWCQKVA